MPETELMSIGAFAKLAGLTASALRFYDDAGLLRPVRVDPMTGYRWYGSPQVNRARQLRQLREIGMPLPVIGQFFAAGLEEAERLIDAQAAQAAMQAAEIERAVAVLKESLSEGHNRILCSLPGPILAGAVDQVLAATLHDLEVPVLSGVRLEAEPDVISLIATDRYRLAMRTLVPSSPLAGSWAGTLAGEDLRAASSRLRRSPMVTVEVGERYACLRLADGTDLRCRLLEDIFPDHRLLISSLPAVTHRIALNKQQIIKYLEHHAPERIGLRIADARPSLMVTPDVVLDLEGTATGSDLTLWFQLITLYPALIHALGSDVMLDLRGVDQPITVRSADAGDLTTLVMPCRDPGSMHPAQRKTAP